MTRTRFRGRGRRGFNRRNTKSWRRLFRVMPKRAQRYINFVRRYNLIRLGFLAYDFYQLYQAYQGDRARSKRNMERIAELEASIREMDERMKQMPPDDFHQRNRARCERNRQMRRLIRKRRLLEHRSRFVNSSFMRTGASIGVSMFSAETGGVAGGYAGMQAGAMAGIWLGPFGSAMGAAVGGLAGSIAGDTIVGTVIDQVVDVNNWRTFGSWFQWRSTTGTAQVQQGVFVEEREDVDDESTDDDGLENEERIESENEIIIEEVFEEVDESAALINNDIPRQESSAESQAPNNSSRLLSSLSSYLWWPSQGSSM